MLALEDSLTAISSTDSVEELRHLMNRTFASLGYAGFTYLDVRRLPLSGEPVPFFVSTAPEYFNQTYITENFFSDDPVVRRAATTNAPFTWADCAEFHSWKKSRRGAKNRARYVMQVANEFGYTQGYVLPSHAVDSHGRPASALVTLYWRDQPEALIPAASMPAWLRLVSASMHEKMLQLRDFPNEDTEPPLLTDRERECLVWACRGKTRGETAEILSISDRTVEFHFQNAMRKLRVHNKFHAIAMAIHMGLIVP
jgi:DNA-binding CsgD family transcriptional regulator